MADLLRAVRDVAFMDVEVDGRRVDVILRDGRVGGELTRGAEVVDGRGGACFLGCMTTIFTFWLWQQLRALSTAGHRQ